MSARTLLRGFWAVPWRAAHPHLSIMEGTTAATQASCGPASSAADRHIAGLGDARDIKLDESRRALGHQRGTTVAFAHGGPLLARTDHQRFDPVVSTEQRV